MKLKEALKNYSLDQIRTMAESAVADTRHLKIGKMGSRRITQTGLEGSVSVNDLWAAVAEKSKNAKSPFEVEDTKKAIEKLDSEASQKLKTKSIAKILHFLPHFFGGIGADRKKNIQSINSKIAELKSTHNQAAELDRINALINSKADLNAKDDWRGVELIRAIENGYSEVVKLLLDNGASATQQFSENALINSKADLDDWRQVELIRSTVETPLNLALTLKNFEVAEELMRAGADINAAIPRTGNRPLENAILDKNPEAVEFLLKNHADPNFYHFERSPLTLALQNNDDVIAQSLIQGGADINAADPQTRDTPLIRSINAGNLEAVKLLLDRGADLEIPSSVGPPLLSALIASEKEIADLLLEKGANPNAGTLSRTPLIYLIRKGDREGVDKLIAKGADLNASAAMCTPLMAAMETNNRYYATRLVDAGANINYREPLSKETVLERACRKGSKDDVEFLVGLGASAVPEDIAFRYTPLGITLFESQSPDKWDRAEALITLGSVDLNKYDGDISTYLNTVIASGDLRSVELILKHGKNINLNYADNISIQLPLQVALERKTGGHEIAELLIEAGADIKQKDAYGNTCLHRAIQQNRPDNVAFLMSRWDGDLTQPVNDDGKSPLDLMRASKDPKIRGLIPT